MKTQGKPRNERAGGWAAASVVRGVLNVVTHTPIPLMQGWRSAAEGKITYSRAFSGVDASTVVGRTASAGIFAAVR